MPSCSWHALQPQSSVDIGCIVAGPVTVVGIREGSLWLVDSAGHPFTIPVNHAGLKARCLSAQGDSQAARLLAERGLSSQPCVSPVTSM